MAHVGELLQAGTTRLRQAGSESPRLDTELLLGWALGLERTGLLAHIDAPVGAEARSVFDRAIERRAAGEPVAYIRGLKEFYGLAFSVDARALIPRPETEILVAAAERWVASRLTSAPRPPGTPPVRVVDVGTGSAAIVVALARLLERRKMLPEVGLTATDASAEALDLARENAVAHGIADRIEFLEADLLPEGTDPFDLIVANLPYIPSDDVDRLPVAASFEPRLALDGGPDGLTQVRRLIALLPDSLCPDGAALLEIGFDQGAAVEELVAALPGTWRSWIEKDLSGRPRLLHADREPAAPGAAGWRLP